MQAFTERWDLSAGCVFRRQDLFGSRHPNYADDVGIAISPRLAVRVKDADVVPTIDIHLGKMTISSYTFFDVPRPEQTLVHMHADAEELGRIYQADLTIHASVPAIVEAPDGVSPDTPPRWSAWTEATNADYRANITPPPFGGKSIDMARAMQWLRECLPQNSILTDGTGNYATWLHRFYQYSPLAAGSRTRFAPASRVMGCGTLAAVVAEIVYPDTPVICMAGDGYFLMNGQKLAIAMQYNVPVILIVADNGIYSTIRMHQEREYSEHVNGMELCNPDSAMLVRAYNAGGHMTRSPEGFRSVVKVVLTVSVATIIEVQTDPSIISLRVTIDSLRAQSCS